MNVSKGDLAISIREGQICTVLESCTFPPVVYLFGPCWTVEFQVPIPVLSATTLEDRGLNKIVVVPDKFLRRICPPPSELIPDPIELPSEVI